MLTTQQESLFDADTKKNVVQWLEGPYDEETKNEIRRLLEENPQKLVDAFYTTLSFGTGGMRGIMGVGTNRLNGYTIRAATQGLANYINKQEKGEGVPSVFVGYDSRRNSRYFAEETAKVLAANGIRVYLTEQLRPTPLVSFGCRHYRCSAAVMITASHNPPDYNGYKVYWNDGGQVVPPHDTGIIKEVNAIQTPDSVKTTSLDSPLIQFVGEEVDQAYYHAVKDYPLYAHENHRHGKDLKIVYTPLHGTGITMVPAMLKLWGFSHVILVDKQKDPDGAFPTTSRPNPEEKAALALGIETLQHQQADLLLATDPDADRVGIVVWHEGKPYLCNGNEVACLCLHHVCKALQEQKKLPSNAGFVKTIVTTELFRVIAEAYGKTCYDVLPGFKYIAMVIREWEGMGDHTFVFGGEESYGYLLHTHCRDKDAVILSALIAEMALQAKKQKKTLVDVLYDIYRQYGIYREHLLSVNFPETKAGKEQMDKAMANLRAAPPKEVKGITVVAREDYATRLKTDVKTGATKPITLPKSNVLVWWLSDGTKVVVRPSGTEPKIKIYCGVCRKAGADVDKDIEACDAQGTDILSATKKLLATH